MLFLLKRGVPGALAALLVLALSGLGLRALAPSPAPLVWTPHALLLGLTAFGIILLSDGLIHFALLATFRERYARRHRELVQLFRGQTIAAMLAGALMAGVGEELVFRGLSLDPVYLGASAVLFGLLHHVRASLWPFTVWAVWQGLLLAGALVWSGNLAVPMVAHFLHDLTGFLLFRYLSARAAPPSV